MLCASLQDDVLVAGLDENIPSKLTLWVMAMDGLKAVPFNKVTGCSG